MKLLALLLLFVVGTGLCLAQTNEFAKMHGLNDLRIVNGNLYDLSKSVPITGKLAQLDAGVAVLTNERLVYDEARATRDAIDSGSSSELLRALAMSRMNRDGKLSPFSLSGDQLKYFVRTTDETRIHHFPPNVKAGAVVAVRAVPLRGGDFDCGVPFKGDIHDFKTCYIPTPKGMTALKIPTKEEFAEKLQADKAKVEAAKKRGEDFRKPKENPVPAKDAK